MNMDASFRANLFKNPFLNPPPPTVSTHATMRLPVPLQLTPAAPLNGVAPVPHTPPAAVVDTGHDPSYATRNASLHHAGPRNHTAPGYLAPPPQSLNGKDPHSHHEPLIHLPQSSSNSMMRGQCRGPLSEPHRLQQLRAYPVSLPPGMFVINAGGAHPARSRGHSMDGSIPIFEDRSPVPVQPHDLLYHSEPQPGLAPFPCLHHLEGAMPPPQRGGGGSAGLLVPSAGGVNQVYPPNMHVAANGWPHPRSPAATPCSGRSDPGALADVLDDYAGGDSGFGRGGTFSNGVASRMRRNSINGDIPTPQRVHNLAVPRDCPPPPAPPPAPGRHGVPGPMPPARAALPPPLSEDSTHARFPGNASTRLPGSNGGSSPLPPTHHYAESPQRRVSASVASVPEMLPPPCGSVLQHHHLEPNPRAALPPVVPLHHPAYGPHPVAMPPNSHRPGITAAAVAAAAAGHAPAFGRAQPGHANAIMQRSAGAYTVPAALPHALPVTARAAVHSHAVMRWQHMRHGSSHVVRSSLH
jgi:hypothetical protein